MRKIAFSYLIITALISIPIYKPVFTTLSFNKTLSQRLSNDGRKEILNTGLNIFQKSPIMGIGSYTFPLQYALDKRKSEDVKYNSNITNAYLSILVEKGIVGLFLYGILFILILINSWRKIVSSSDAVHKTELILFFCTLIAVLSRELFYSSILINDFAFLLIFIMLFFLSHDSQFETFSIKRKNSGLVIDLSFLCLAFFTLFISAKNYISGYYYNSAVIAYKEGHISKSVHYFKKSISYNQFNAHYQSYVALSTIRDLGTEISIHNLLSEKPSPLHESYYPQIDLSIEHYQTAIALATDASFFHNLAWLYVLKSDYSKAIKYFKRAVQIEPNIALYHISLGLIYERSNHNDDAVHEYQFAIRLSPEILDSEFFDSLKMRSNKMAYASSLLAERALENFLQKSSDVKIKAKLAKIYLNNGKLNEAYELLQYVIKELPNLNRPYLYLGDIYASKGNVGQMLKCYNLSKKLDQKDYLVDIKLGNYYSNSNDAAKARYFTLLADQRQKKVISENSIRVPRCYLVEKRIPNDLVLSDLLQYTKPRH